MNLRRLILQALRRSTTLYPPGTASTTRTLHAHPHCLLSLRSFAFSSAEEAAAERRRRKRRLRIEPPLHALRRDPSAPRPPPDPKAALLPDSTSALVGNRLNLHNRVQSLIRAGDLDNASAVARQAVFSSVRPTVFTCNAITAAMYRAKRYNESIALFHYFFKQSNINPNVVSYNFLINTLCDQGEVNKAVEVYHELLENAPFTPSSVTYRHLTKGMVDAGRIQDGVDLLREMLNKGLGADSLVYNNLIKGFLDLGNLDKANELFDELKGRCLVYDGVVSATFMDWFFNQGREKEAMESYKYLLDRQFRMTPATCNVLLEVLLRHDRKKEAWDLFDSMLDNHTPPTVQAVNSETFSIMVNECFKLGKYSEAVETFRKAGTKVASKPFAMDVAGYTNIVVKFCENGMISEAENLFQELLGKSLSPDVTGYKTLIDAYLKEQRIDDAVQMFRRMVDANLRVIPVYANKWFSELIQNNKVMECSEILMRMGERDPKPDASNYEIVIKGLCQVGAFDAAKSMISQVMSYGVGVTPTFREFLRDTFREEGQGEEIERLFAGVLGFTGYTQPPQPAHSSNPPAFLPNTVPAGPKPADPPEFLQTGPAGPHRSGPAGPHRLGPAGPYRSGPVGPYQSGPYHSGPGGPYHSGPTGAYHGGRN
ncbi:Pentatricopeptide repeat-containing protein At1g10270 [Dionaea muscipula]